MSQLLIALKHRHKHCGYIAKHHVVVIALPQADTSGVAIFLLGQRECSAAER